MKINHILLISFILLGSFLAHSAEIETQKSAVSYYVKTETTFPLFVGAGVGINIIDKFDFNLMYGITPEIYYNTIGDVAANYGGNSSYRDVIVAAFQNNNSIRAQGNYFFDSPKSGWLIGGDFSYLSANGQASVDKVLTAATGRDYTNLKNLLIAAGKSTQVDMTTTILGVRGGYSWDLSNNFIFKTTLGVAKVVSSTVSLKTGLTGFESSPYGSSTISTAENDVQSIINDNGMTPTISAEIAYSF